jgi:hypothetical protein
MSLWHGGEQNSSSRPVLSGLFLSIRVKSRHVLSFYGVRKMKIEFDNEELKKIVLEYALEKLHIEFGEDQEMVCTLSGYSSYNTVATVSIERVRG